MPPPPLLARSMLTSHTLLGTLIILNATIPSTHKWLKTDSFLAAKLIFGGFR
jgi:hypothetical protein